MAKKKVVKKAPVKKKSAPVKKTPKASATTPKKGAKEAKPAPKKALPAKNAVSKAVPEVKKVVEAPAPTAKAKPVIGAAVVPLVGSKAQAPKGKTGKSSGFEDENEETDLEFVEDERARHADLEEDEEEAEGPPPWWKDDPTGIEDSEDEDFDENKAVFDDSDEWTEDDEWEPDTKTTDVDDDNW